MIDSIADRQLRRAAPVAGFEQTDLVLWSDDALGIGKIQLRPSVDLARLESETGLRSPLTRCSYELKDVTVSWLAPGEWLLTGEPSVVASALAAVGDVAGDLGLALDISHGTSAFVLSGDRARDALAGLTPLNLSDEALPVGAVARTLLGEATIFIARRPDASGAPCFRIIVDQTMGAYTVRMLAGSAPSRGAGK